MFSIIKMIVWIAGLGVIAYFVMGYFGYEINMDYFTSSKKLCEERLQKCKDEFIQKGLDNCNFKCVEPKLIIKKK